MYEDFGGVGGMITEQNLLFALGLAQKAGKTASGDFAVRGAIKKGKVKLLLVAADAAENSKKDLVYMCQDYHVTLIEVLDRQRLGAAIGKAQRTAVAIIDNNFVKMIMK